jgi:hypothetical protein
MTRRRRRESGEKRPRQRVGVGAILADAARAGWRYRWRILAVAVVVRTVTALLEILVEEFADRANIPVSLVGGLSSSAVSLLGAVFLSGFLCKLLGQEGDGADRVSVRKVMRTLPWWRLIGADLLVALFVVIGVILLVIPGLIAVNLFAVVGPVIDIEHPHVFSALRRSAHLVRQHFWTVALLVTLPVAAASALEVTPASETAPAILAALATRGLAGAVVEAAIGLVEVKLCLRLIALDRERIARKASADRARSGDRD